MSLLSSIKKPIKQLRWNARRSRNLRKYGADKVAQTPIVIGNAMPKSGSHLLHQILMGLTHIGPFVDPGMPPLTRSVENQNLPIPQVLKRINQLQAGDIAYGYFQALPEYLDALTAEKVASIFITRDPRDVLVSHVFYATDMYPGHGMHRYYNSLPNMEARLNAAIEGVDDGHFQLSAIRAKYERYLAWLTTPGVEKIKFESLILEQKRTLGQILSFLHSKGYSSDIKVEDAIVSLMQSIQPGKSGTFRGGRVGDWKQHFSAENKARFKERSGDLLITLNYEAGSDW